MLPFVRPALAALLFTVPALAIVLLNYPPNPALGQIAWAMLLVALPCAGASAYASGWLARTRSTGELLFRGAVVGLAGAVNTGLIGFVVLQNGPKRLGTVVLAAAVVLALPALVYGAGAAYLHRRWAQ